MEDKILCDLSNVMHVLSLETSKTFFFCEFIILLGPDIKVSVGIQIKISENTFQFLKCQGIKKLFLDKNDISDKK